MPKQNTKKNGSKNKLQRYKCLECNKTFSLSKKLNSAEIWYEYTVKKQTYQQLADKYHCSIRTIQRHILKAPKTPFILPQYKYLIPPSLVENLV